MLPGIILAGVILRTGTLVERERRDRAVRDFDGMIDRLT